ncbi:hypothetical protein ANO14919_106000 [Xylariales sp. No.14919]|nr:hypothetical protein ANO14919_106000 [Xylariales sp. No.14919]
MSRVRTCYCKSSFKKVSAFHERSFARAPRALLASSFDPEYDAVPLAPRLAKMCHGVASYYIQCGHSAVEWQKCEHPGTFWCNTTQKDEFRNDTCNHRWCPCDGEIWTCCTCRKLNMWGDCIGCKGVKCYRCVYTPRLRGEHFQDSRYVEWKRQYDAQEAARSK